MFTVSGGYQLGRPSFDSFFGGMTLMAVAGEREKNKSEIDPLRYFLHSSRATILLALFGAFEATLQFLLQHMFIYGLLNKGCTHFLSACTVHSWEHRFSGIFCVANPLCTPSSKYLLCFIAFFLKIDPFSRANTSLFSKGPASYQLQKRPGSMCRRPLFLESCASVGPGFPYFLQRAVRELVAKKISWNLGFGELGIMGNHTQTFQRPG